jgi:hypothetical protein
MGIMKDVFLYEPILSGWAKQVVNHIPVNNRRRKNLFILKCGWILKIGSPGMGCSTNSLKKRYGQGRVGKEQIKESIE